MLFSVLRMDNRLRLNLFLLALIFGVGVPPKAVEAVKCYVCAVNDGQADCPDKFQKYAANCSESDYCKKRIKESKVITRDCVYDETEKLDCILEKLGSNCYSEYRKYREARDKCSGTVAGAGRQAREAISEGDSNTNGTTAPPAVTVPSGTESGKKEKGLEDEQARQALGPGGPTSTTCYCKGNLCNDNKKLPGEPGEGTGATLALSHRLIFFVIGVAVASTKYSLG